VIEVSELLTANKIYKLLRWQKRQQRNGE